MSNPTQSETLLREALEPFKHEIDRLEREYGLDRPKHQFQPLMISIGDILQLRIALQSIPEPLLDEGMVERVASQVEAHPTKEPSMPGLSAHFPEIEYHGAANYSVKCDCGFKTKQDNFYITKAEWAKHAALSIPRLEAGRVTGSLTLDNASVQRLMDYGLLHYTDEGWIVSKDIWNASAPDGLPLVERMRPMADALLAVVEATRAYLPPDGIDAQECLNRIIGATDNPEINPIIREIENGR